MNTIITLITIITLCWYRFWIIHYIVTCIFHFYILVRSGTRNWHYYTNIHQPIVGSSKHVSSYLFIQKSRHNMEARSGLHQRLINLAINSIFSLFATISLFIIALHISRLLFAFFTHQNILRVDAKYFRNIYKIWREK